MDIAREGNFYFFRALTIMLNTHFHQFTYHTIMLRESMTELSQAEDAVIINNVSWSPGSDPTRVSQPRS